MQIFAVIGLLLLLALGACYVERNAARRVEARITEEALENTHEAHARARRNLEVADAARLERDEVNRELTAQLAAAEAEASQQAGNRARIAELEAARADLQKAGDSDGARIAELEAELSGLRAITVEGAACVPGCILPD